MQKRLTWNNDQVLISDGRSCSITDETDKETRQFQTESLSCLSPNGLFVAVCEDTFVRVRKVVSSEWRLGDVLFTCQKLPNQKVQDFAWSPASDILAVHASQAIYTFKVGPTMRQRHDISPGVYQTLLASPLMVFAPQKSRIALSTLTANLEIWETDSLRLVRTLKTGTASSIAWSPDERFLAVGSHDNSLTIYLVRSGRLIYECRGEHPGPVSALAWSPNGRCIASGDCNGKLMLWRTEGDPKTWKPLGPIEPSMQASIDAMAWDPSGKKLAVVDCQDILDFFSL